MGAANTIAVGTKAARAGDDTDRYYGTSTSQSSTWFGRYSSLDTRQQDVYGESMLHNTDRTLGLERLAEGVNELTTSATWHEFLRVQATFHQYSYRNALLISRQLPNASHVAGFRSWRSLGRSVRRGERAIWILAPAGQRLADEETDPISPRFIAVPVFDISQTEGKDLPIVCRPLQGGEDRGVFQRLAHVGHKLGYRVDLCELSNGVNGECRFSDRLIRIESRNGPSQRVKSLAHELAHAILHADATDRSLAELEAESAAYIICQRFDIDSSDYSFGYVATWARDAKNTTELIHRSCDRIQSAVQRVLELEVSPRSASDVAWVA